MTRTVLILAALLATTAAWAGEGWGPYRATVERVIDGDTVEVLVDVWPDITIRARVRLDGVDTPEMRGSAACERELAAKATEFTRQFLEGASEVLVLVDSLDKYGGRVVGSIRVGGRDLGHSLLEAGHARPYGGGKRSARPWC